MKPILKSLAFVTLVGLSVSFAQVTNRGDEGVPGQEFRPAPESIAPDVPLIVSSPSPSDVNPSLLGPVLLLKSGRVDMEAGTVTLPLHEGRMQSGESVWYVLTDATDEGIAELLGLNHAPKMLYADFNNGVRSATAQPDGTLVFERGAVDFSPELIIEPGEALNFFPPSRAEPGSVGDEFYTPLVKTTNLGGTIVYNAPVIAYDVAAEELNLYCNGDADHSVVHDKVVAICPEEGTVTLTMTLGYSFAKPIWLSFDANNPVATALEGATLTPVYDDLGIDLEDAQVGSGVERILAVTNGPTGLENPGRQGLNSALSDGRGPINVLGGIPTMNLDYSPLWDLMLLQWTDEAIEAGYRTRLIGAFHALQYEAQGFITDPDGNPVGSSGIIINCPVVMRLN